MSPAVPKLHAERARATSTTRMRALTPGEVAVSDVATILEALSDFRGDLDQKIEAVGKDVGAVREKLASMDGARAVELVHSAREAAERASEKTALDLRLNRMEADITAGKISLAKIMAYAGGAGAAAGVAAGIIVGLVMRLLGKG